MNKAEAYVEQEIIKRSEQCPRGIIAMRNDGQAGIGLRAPNCLIFSWMMIPVPDSDFIFDLILN